MRPTPTDVTWSPLRLYVCRLCVSKSNEPLDMPFGIWIRVGQKNNVSGGGPDPPRGRGNYGGVSCDAAFRRNSLTACYLYI